MPIMWRGESFLAGRPGPLGIILATIGILVLLGPSDELSEFGSDDSGSAVLLARFDKLEVQYCWDAEPAPHVPLHDPTPRRPPRLSSLLRELRASGRYEREEVNGVSQGVSARESVGATKHEALSAVRRRMMAPLAHEDMIPQGKMVGCLISALLAAVLTGIALSVMIAHLRFSASLSPGTYGDLPSNLMMLHGLNALLWLGIFVLFVVFLRRASWNARCLAGGAAAFEYTPRQFTVAALAVYFFGPFNIFAHPNMVLFPGLGRVAYRSICEIWIVSRRELPSYLAWWGELVVWRAFVNPLGVGVLGFGKFPAVLFQLDAIIDVLLSLVTVVLVWRLHRDQLEHHHFQHPVTLDRAREHGHGLRPTRIYWDRL